MTFDRSHATTHWTDGYASLQQLNQVVEASGLEATLIELVRMRASQINGCAYCIDRHAKDARAAGETEQRLYAVGAWRETAFFTERERAALALTEATTLVAEGNVPSNVIEEAARHFLPTELSHLIYAVIEINAWNRLAITVGRPEPGSYRVPGARATA